MSSEKANRYINQLYAARCNGLWSAVPELARKVEKHAPSRKCLALTARFGASLRLESHSFLATSEAQHYLEALTAAASADHEQELEVFEAKIYKGLLLSASGSSQEALSILTSSDRDLHQPSSYINDRAVWAAVCIINGNAAKAEILEALKDKSGATKTYSDYLPQISLLLQEQPHPLELLRSIQQFLSNACLCLYGANTGTGGAQRESLIEAFRLLSKVDAKTTGKVPSRRVLRMHLNVLSQLISEGSFYTQNGLCDRESLEPTEIYVLSSQLYQEYLQACTEYEDTLLQETRFPKATQKNEEVLMWVNLVMDNWTFLCGPDWSDDELGSGGKIALGRKILDILYRATTKTFHSTPLLRHLFTIHAFLGEFELAFKAFDVYIEIITKGKARMEKSGEPISDLDDDETSILLAVNAIKISCRYGSAEAAEKARDIAALLEKWLKKGQSKSSDNAILNGEREQSENMHNGIMSISSAALASAHRAVGISQAQWSRYTYDVKLRGELQQKAIQSLRNSLKYTPKGTQDIECLFALALVQGETRDITTAVDTAKQALRPPNRVDSSAKTNGDLPADSLALLGSINRHFSQERRLLPVWHLLSLLLTTREAFGVAEESCQAAFSQFKDEENLFGKGNIPASRLYQRPRKLSATLLDEKNLVSESSGLVDSMDLFEKQYILDIKMTQMLLLEIEEGPEVAVNTGHELLALYARLFGLEDNLENRSPQTASSTIPPQSSKGLTRSKFAKDTPLPSRPTTTATSAPTIQIDKDNGIIRGDEKPYFDHSNRKAPESALKSGTSVKPRNSKEFVQSQPATARVETQQPFDVDALAEKNMRRSLDKPKNQSENWPLAPLQQANSLFAKNGISNVSHQESISKEPKSDDQILNQDCSSPLPKRPRQSLPDPHLLGMQRLRFRTRTLVRIWLLVAGLYCRASLFEDSREAVEEAEKLVAVLEAKICLESSGIKAFQDKAWGTGESLEDLWADIHSERGNLLSAESLPHQAMESFETALLHCPDHIQATVGLSKILLDIYCQIIPPEIQDSVAVTGLLRQRSEANPSIQEPLKGIAEKQDSSVDGDLSAPERNRLAARDRACGLLSSVTKLGNGWDHSEAWFVLARAYEESGQTDKAKDALWWTVELENTKPLRHWRNVNPGGYVL